MKKTFVSLLLLFATFGAHGQEDDNSSSICAAEGEWKTNMCAKIIDFYGDVSCRKKLLVVQEDGSTIDIVETITTLFAENLELKNRLAAVESTHGGSSNRRVHHRRVHHRCHHHHRRYQSQTTAVGILSSPSVWPKLRSPASARRGHLRILTERYRTGIRVW